MVCAVLLVSRLAHADVVGPPPEECPNGAVGVSTHLGPWCTPHVCAERPCEAGTACETTGVCVFEEERPCGGLSSGECTFVYREAFGPCESDEDCSSGACVVDEYCIDPSSAGGGSRCGCSNAAGASAVFLLGLLLPLVRARGRQR